MSRFDSVPGCAAALAALMLAVPVQAQTPAENGGPAPAAAQGETTPNPHAILPELNGGPTGTPTAQRGAPVPGTSTAIPTTNPAPSAPVPQDAAGAAAGSSGIDRQCDPVVGLANCPTPPGAATAPDAAAEAPAAATDAPDASAAPRVTVEVIEYRCDGGKPLQVAYVNGGEAGFAIVSHEGKLESLQQQVSASGSIYGTAPLQLLTKGDEATLDGQNGAVECRRQAQWPKARLPAASGALTLAPRRPSNRLAALRRGQREPA